VSDPGEEQAWLPFEEFLVSGAQAPKAPPTPGVPAEPLVAGDRTLPRILLVG
jgi:hypothetical protein